MFDCILQDGRDVRGEGETLVLGSSRSLDCGGLIHNTSCPAPPSQQMALWWKCFFSPLENREVVPSHCIVPQGGTESALPLFQSLLHLWQLWRENMQIRFRGNQSRWRKREKDAETRELSPGSSCWVLVINPDMRDSGSLCPTFLHLTGIRPPTTLCFSSGASALQQLQQHPLCKFYNHTTATRDVCVRTLKRDISFYLAYEMSWD